MAGPPCRNQASIRVSDRVSRDAATGAITRFFPVCASAPRQHLGRAGIGTQADPLPDERGVFRYTKSPPQDAAL